MIGHEEDRGAGWAEGHLAALVQGARTETVRSMRRSRPWPTPWSSTMRRGVRDAAGRPLPPDRLPVLRAACGEVLSGPTAVDLRFTALDGRRIEANVTLRVC